MTVRRKSPKKKEGFAPVWVAVCDEPHGSVALRGIIVQFGRPRDAEIIELCVRWYITYRLSYRDLVAMMAERGISVSHTTIHRWVIRYVPEFEKRWNRFARPVNTSWRVDETYIKIRGQFSYLYRAVDKRGKPVVFLLRPVRGL